MHRPRSIPWQAWWPCRQRPSKRQAERKLLLKFLVLRPCLSASFPTTPPICPALSVCAYPLPTSIKSRTFWLIWRRRGILIDPKDYSTCPTTRGSTARLHSRDVVSFSTSSTSPSCPFLPPIDRRRDHGLHIELPARLLGPQPFSKDL